MCRSSSSGATRSRSTPGPVSTSSAPSRILRVGQVVTRLAAHIQSGDEFKDLWIEGEVVQARSSPVGHVYFTLRDNVGQLQCVLFAMKAAQVALTPRDGNKVLAHGYIELYTKDGRCQLQVDDLRPAAPRRIGVVTSPIGAVWHDIQQIVARRDPRVELILAPAQVQGIGAVESLIAALDGLAQIRDLDVVILARGGGAAEDLAPFNDEALVRALARFPRPVCSGVGHETDVTLADLAADVRAPTPSAAAELVVPDSGADQMRAARAWRRVAARVRERIEDRRRRLETARRMLDRRAPAMRLAVRRQRIDEARRTLDRAIARAVPLRRQRAVSAQRRLAALSPLAVLGRGYAIVEGPDGHIRASVAVLKTGERVRVRMRDGRAGALVETVEKSGFARGLPR